MTRELGSLLQHLLLDFSVNCYTHPGATFAQVVKNLQSLTSSFTKEDYVFIQAGTNDVPYFYPSRINENLEAIKSVLFKTNVIVSSIPYMHHKEGKKNNSNIFASNQYLLQMSSKYNFLFFDANCFLSRSMYTKHGLHLNYSGKCTLSKKLSIRIRSVGDDVIVKGGENVSISTLNTGIQPDQTVWLSDISCPLSDSTIDIDSNVSFESLSQFFRDEDAQ